MLRFWLTDLSPLFDSPPSRPRAPVEGSGGTITARRSQPLRNLHYAHAQFICLLQRKRVGQLATSCMQLTELRLVTAKRTSHMILF